MDNLEEADLEASDTLAQLPSSIKCQARVIKTSKTRFPSGQHPGREFTTTAANATGPRKTGEASIGTQIKTCAGEVNTRSSGIDPELFPPTRTRGASIPNLRVHFS